MTNTVNTAAASGAADNCTILPDGSAFAVGSFPLPQDHWLYAPHEYEPGADEPKELLAPILTHAQRNEVVAAVRYAVRGATMCGKEPDFDPDALVQNAVYALCGSFGRTALATTAQATPAAAPTTQPAPRQAPSHTSMHLAEMVLSDCGHSSNYTPLLERVAARIDAHVERCLESKKTPQQEAQEPVMIYHGGCTIDCGEHGHHNVELLRMIPAGSKLYTAPQPVEREPLTDEAVDLLCKVGPVYVLDGKVTRTPAQYRDELKAAQRYGLRKGERAHGIKGGQHGTE